MVPGGWSDRRTTLPHGSAGHVSDNTQAPDDGHRGHSTNGAAYRWLMAERGHVKVIDDGAPPLASRSWRTLAATAAAVLLLGWLLGYAPAPAEETPVAGVEEMRQAGLSDEVAGLTRALDIVRRFEAALDSDDGQSAIATIAADWGRLEIPGTSQGMIPPGDVAAMRETLAFAASVADLDLGDCAASPARLGAVAGYAVVCTEPEVTGTYPEAIGRAGEGQPMVFAVAGDHIISISWSGYPGDRYDTTAYCEFARGESEVVAQRAFDEECRPIETPAALELHRNLAALYVATGRPTPGVAVLEARYALPTVQRLLTAMDTAAPLGDYVDTEATLVGFPGMMLDPAVPRLRDTGELLGWIGAVYDVDLGPCNVAGWRGGHVVVRCQEATWSGPLVAALGLALVAQPIEFLVDDFVVTDFAGDTAPELEEAFHDMCEWTRREAPVQAEWAFEEGCLPDLSMTGVSALLDAADRYAVARALTAGVSPSGS